MKSNTQSNIRIFSGDVVAMNTYWLWPTPQIVKQLRGLLRLMLRWQSH
jgi:hypothetical protein